MWGSTPAVSLTDLGWKIAEFGQKKLEEENASLLNVLARTQPALDSSSLQRAITETAKETALRYLTKQDQSEKK